MIDAPQRVAGRVAPSFEHLDRLSDSQGIFEHARFSTRRVSHGYCTDDNARLLIVAAREPNAGVAGRLCDVALRFVLDSQEPDGSFRNRMNADRSWEDKGSVEDCWGRAMWGLGVAVAHHDCIEARQVALDAFRRGAILRSPSTRALAFAALGAAEILTAYPHETGAYDLLRDFAASVGPTDSLAWSWPEATLRYANASIAEALIASGAWCGVQADFMRGTNMLRWLLDAETIDGHLSVVGASGRIKGAAGPQFDQQPIEVAAMADACLRAWNLTGDSHWRRGIDMATNWFMGFNDVGLVMYDPQTGGGFDGLQHDSVNLNQGAESTLAFVSTMQVARQAALRDQVAEQRVKPFLHG